MNLKKKYRRIVFFVVLGVLVLFFVWGIFVPNSLSAKPPIVYDVQKGMGYSQIGIALQQQGIIKNHGFFSAYALISLNYNKLQAGSYEISPSMSVAQIVNKFALGEVIKNNLTIIEGWDIKDIGNYLQSKNIISQKDFLVLASQDESQQYDFLADKPKTVNLEGYLFPDTYQYGPQETPQELLNIMLSNFGTKLTPQLRAQISSQHKTIFQIVTMASILEKEVQTSDDKKMVAGILWKRIQNGMPLQVDSTINYITGNNGPISLQDTKINSPYNTYKYYGLPPGPICNPGLDSILAAINPTSSDYWYYLSVPKTGQTIFSETLAEQNSAIQKYLK